MTNHIQHPLSVGTRVKYNNSSCGCNQIYAEGMITKVETLATVLIYEIDNGKKIPSRRIIQIL